MKSRIGFLAALLFGLVACNAKDKSKRSDAGEEDGSSDDAVDGSDGILEGDVVAPFNLWDSDIYARAIDKMPPTLVGTAVADDPDAAPPELAFTTSPFVDANTNFAYEVAAQSVPHELMLGMRKVLQNLRHDVKKMFGEGGLYAGQEVKLEVTNGKASVTYAIYDKNTPATLQPSYHVISYDAAEDYPFTIEIWNRTTANVNGFSLGSRWQIRQVPDTEILATRVMVVAPQTDGVAAGGKVYALIDYVTGESSVTMHFGGGNPTAFRTERAIVRYDFDETTASAQGAYVVGGGTDSASSYEPRYRHVASGDVNFFRRYAGDGDQLYGDGIQELATWSKESLPSPFVVDKSVFTSHRYLPDGLAALAALVQDPTRFPGCATAGTDFKTRLQTDSIAIPGSLDTAPASLCSGSASADLVINILWDIVFPTTNAQYQMMIDAQIGGSTKTIDLKDELLTANFLSNPLGVKINGQGSCVTSAYSASTFAGFKQREPVGAAHIQLYERLKALKFPDVSTLLTQTWPTAEERLEADFTVEAELGR